jgi:myo-inositol 2-dehydrogenase/D-chiro-inositol 1-dehydrogenase
LTIRFGLVGYGLFGRWHARFLAAAEGAALAAICTTSAENQAAAGADHPGARVLGDWAALVRAPDIDAVAITAPNHLHARIAIAALEAGKHVLVEKPLATTAEDCDRVVEAVRRTGGLLSVGHELRLSRQWAAVKRLIEEGALGSLAYANLALFRFPYRSGAGGWRHDAARVGSWILEEPVHFYDLILWYTAGLGPPISVLARGSAGAVSGMTSNFTSILSFAGGAYATIGQSLAGFGHHLVLELAGDAGALRSTWSAADARSERPTFALTVKRAGATAAEAISLDASGELVELEAEIGATVAAFAAGRVVVSAEEGRRAVLVCLAAEQALREGREVALDL